MTQEVNTQGDMFSQTQKSLKKGMIKAIAAKPPTRTDPLSAKANQ